MTRAVRASATEACGQATDVSNVEHEFGLGQDRDRAWRELRHGPDPCVTVAYGGG